MKKWKLSNSSKRHLEGVRSPVKMLVERMLTRSPHDFGIPKYGGKRTAEEQYELFQRKPSVTKLDGYRKTSYHQTGFAFDIYIYDEHGACWGCKHKYKEFANVAKEVFKEMQDEGHFCKSERLVWGGDWKIFKDFPHFEIRNS